MVSKACLGGICLVVPLSAGVADGRRGHSHLLFGKDAHLEVLRHSGFAVLIRRHLVRLVLLALTLNISVATSYRFSILSKCLQA